MSSLILFFVGIIEMAVIAIWTKVVSRGEMFAGGIVTFINIFIWYYVLQQVTSDIGNWRVVFIYAIGCALGTSLGTWYSKRGDTKKVQSEKAPIATVESLPETV